MWPTLKFHSNFHTRVQYPVACAIEVTINTVYSTLLMYYPLLVDAFFIVTCFDSIEPSSGNIILVKHMYIA
jgi:hypothetical protein